MEPGVSLRTDQIADLAFHIANPKGMNLNEPGTGKTPTICVLQWYRWNEHKHGTAWVMPKTLLEKNRRELLRFTDFTEDQVVIVDGTPKQVAKKLASGAVVFLMGPARWTLSWKQLPSYVRGMDVDEFHKCFKLASSKACQALFQFFDSGHGKYFAPMTGTLVNGRLDSAYPAIRVVEPRYYSSQDSFLHQHAIYDIDNKIAGWKGHDKLSHIFGTHGIRRTFKSIHGEQEIVLIPEVVAMGKKQREMFDKFQEAAILDLEKFYLDGTLPGAAYIRARQLQEHPNEFPDLTNPGQFIDIMPGEMPGKEERLEIDLENHANNGKPFLIFSSMVPQQRRLMKLCQKFGLKVGLINGSVTGKARDKIDVDFQEGRINTIVCSEEVADVGFNWQFCGDQEVDHIAFLAMGYLDTSFLQARQRAIRQARKTPLRVSIYEYEDSLDQKVMSIIWRKSKDANKVDPTRPILQLSSYRKEYDIP